VRARIEFKLEDMWVGVFWRRHEFMPAYPQHHEIQYDVWICLLPCLPIHIVRRVHVQTGKSVSVSWSG
jgi:hypothetical protein